MAEALTAQALAAAIPANTSLDHSRDVQVRCRFTGLTTLDGRGLVFLLAATPPTTRGVSSPIGLGALADFDQPATTDITPGGGLSISFTAHLAHSNMSAWSSGDHLYACLFAVASPGSSAVPDLVVDLGEVF